MDMTTNKRCAICSNAYGTRYICAKCRKGVIAYKDKDGSTKTWQDPGLAEAWVETSGEKCKEVVPDLGLDKHGHRRGCDSLNAYRDTDQPAIFAGKPHVFTLAERGVADGILHGETDAQIARKTGLSYRHVVRLRAWFMKESA